MNGTRAKLPGVARIGIGGPVGSGKTALVERLIPRFVARGTSIAVITNDLVTHEDAERIRRAGTLPDVSFVSAARIPPEGDPVGIWTIAPDLAVEIVSPNDTFEKVTDKIGRASCRERV